jgi:hypothetical protein
LIVNFRFRLADLQPQRLDIRAVFLGPCQGLVHGRGPLIGKAPVPGRRDDVVVGVWDAGRRPELCPGDDDGRLGTSNRTLLFVSLSAHFLSFPSSVSILRSSFKRIDSISRLNWASTAS